MFRRSFLLVKLAIVFLLTTSLVAAVSIYQIKTVDQSNNQLILRVDSDSEMVSKLESIRLKSHDVSVQVSGYWLDYLSGKADDTQARKTEVLKLRQEIKQDKEAYQSISSGSSISSQATVKSLFGGVDTMVGDAIKIVSSPASSPDFSTQVDNLAKFHDALDKKIEAEIISTRRLIDNEVESVAVKSKESTRTNVTLEALAVAVAVILGLLFAEILSRSISKIQKGAERIANGDFSRPIEVKSRDEVGLLAEAFNKMAVRLRDSYARLALERQRDETLLESMSDGLIATDSSSSVVAVNNTAVRLLDLPEPSSLVGKPVEDVLVLRYRDKENSMVAIQERPESKAFALGRPIGDVFSYYKAGSNKILISVGASPIVLDGKNTGAVMIIRDVTREQEVDRMKTEFISLASHQLRTPLSAIKWFTEMLVNGDAGQLNPDQAEFAKNVADSTERMIALVNSLLNISRIESGRIMVDPKPTDLSELVTGIVNDLKAKISERQQNLVISVHKELPKVNLDSRLIGQVYLNLLTNAIKYTPKGGEISVFVSRKGDELVSQISDNGYGIPKPEQVKMFQKFFRASNVSKIETDGTGLGLYLIKAIVESSGGRIWFESEEGKGTTFWFSLPMSGMKPKEGEVTLDQ